MNVSVFRGNGVRECFFKETSPHGKNCVIDYIYRMFQTETDRMPQFFAMNLVHALHAFIEERVDVAIIEVGIGGEYDHTNVIR